MLVTFQTKAYSDITMFGDVAKRLLKLMGHSGTVPSAIAAEDVPAALDRLRAAIARERAVESDAGETVVDDQEREQPRVGIAQRAYPLIELLSAAAAAECGVSWRQY
jgi:hypothetical protein